MVLPRAREQWLVDTLFPTCCTFLLWGRRKLLEVWRRKWNFNLQKGNIQPPFGKPLLLVALWSPVKCTSRYCQKPACYWLNPLPPTLLIAFPKTATLLPFNAQYPDKRWPARCMFGKCWSTLCALCKAYADRLTPLTGSLCPPEN